MFACRPDESVQCALSAGTLDNLKFGSYSLGAHHSREPLHGGRRPNVALMNLIRRDFESAYRQRELEAGIVPLN